MCYLLNSSIVHYCTRSPLTLMWSFVKWQHTVLVISLAELTIVVKEPNLSLVLMKELHFPVFAFFCQYCTFQPLHIPFLSVNTHIGSIVIRYHAVFPFTTVLMKSKWFVLLKLTAFNELNLLASVSIFQTAPSSNSRMSFVVYCRIIFVSSAAMPSKNSAMALICPHYFNYWSLIVLNKSI